MFRLLSHFFFYALCIAQATATPSDAARYHTLNTTVHDESFVPDAFLVFTVDTISQSCVAAKPTVLINGTSPGPEVRLQEGRTSWIRVYNNIADMNVTMHWHGLAMAASPFSDGTPQASQWAIGPGRFFDYEIHIPVGMAGTYFYHSHVEFQAVSATGPLIVEDVGPPAYQYDEEKIIFLTDVFSKRDHDIVSGLGANPFVWSGETSMILVNGMGGGLSNVSGNVPCNAGLSTIHVAPNKTYRLRFIGGTALTFATLAIEGHPNLTVIEADGSYTQPQDTDHIQIGSGQRFSVLLKTMDIAEPKTFYIQLESRDRPSVTRSFALLNYGKPNTPSTTPAKAPLTLPATTLGWLDYQLRPHTPNDFPALSEVTRRVIMTVHQDAKNGTIVWMQNNYPWFETFPKEPYLVSLIKGDGVEFPNYERALANDGIDPVTRTFPAMIGEILEVVVQNTGATKGGLDVHPFHIHGAHVWDIGSGNGTYDVNANEARLKGTSPVLRDSMMLYRYGLTTTPGLNAGWRAWRLKVTQPGVWMVHCHILQHMIMGMQTVWVMGNQTELLSRVHAPEMIEAGYLNYGSNVYGTDDQWPTVIEWNDTWATMQ